MVFRWFCAGRGQEIYSPRHLPLGHDFNTTRTPNRVHVVVVIGGKKVENFYLNGGGWCGEANGSVSHGPI